ncbi:MAG: BatD family protein [Pontiellaceae bacterium]|nr:BatD family protein [Pontiellaceae bacterium]
MKIADFRLTIGFGLIAFNALAFEATLTIQPPLIELGESATLTIEVRDAKKLKPPVLPNVPGLRFVSAGQSQQSTWVNGKSDHFTAFNYQVYPQQTGEFTIGPFEYTADKQTQTLQGSLKVVGSSGDAAQPQSWSDLVFARMETDRESSYVQAPFGMTLSIFSRQGLQMTDQVSLQGMPETGLDELQWQEVQGGRDVINNTIFNVRRFQARTRALSSGTFEFSPSVTVQVVVPNQDRRSRSPFDDPFFGSMFNRTETRPVELPVEKTVINVKPLPQEGKPGGFTGAIGNFDFQVSAQPLEVHPGDPVTLTMTLTGDGNFDRITPPSIPAGDQFRLFGDPVRKQADGAVQFEQVISPRNADVTGIPAINFVFFDTDAGVYRTVQSRPIPLTVTATSNSTAQVFAAKDTVLMPPPETPFATESDLQRISSALQKIWKKVRPWLWTVPAALGLAVAAFFGRRLHRIRRKDTARIRRQKAPKAARKALNSASHARRQNNPTAFYDALWNALTDYFGHRLNLPPGAVSSSATLQALERAGLDVKSVDTLRALFEQVEARRYGLPGAVSPDEMNTLQQDLEQILKQCEKIKL